MVQLSLEEVISSVRIFAAPLLNVDNSDSSKWNPESRMWEQ